MQDETRRELDEFKRSLRNELESALTTVGIQVGSVERTLLARLSSVRWQMVAALLGGQVVAGLMTALVARDWHTPLKPAAAALRLVGIS